MSGTPFNVACTIDFLPLSLSLWEMRARVEYSANTPNQQGMEAQ